MRPGLTPSGRVTLSGNRKSSCSCCGPGCCEGWLAVQCSGLACTSVPDRVAVCKGALCSTGEPVAPGMVLNLSEVCYLVYPEVVCTDSKGCPPCTGKALPAIAGPVECVDGCNTCTGGDLFYNLIHCNDGAPSNWYVQCPPPGFGCKTYNCTKPDLLNGITTLPPGAQLISLGQFQDVPCCECSANCWGSDYSFTGDCGLYHTSEPYNCCGICCRTTDDCIDLDVTSYSYNRNTGATQPINRFFGHSCGLTTEGLFWTQYPSGQTFPWSQTSLSNQGHKPILWQTFPERVGGIEVVNCTAQSNHAGTAYANCNEASWNIDWWNPLSILGRRTIGSATYIHSGSGPGCREGCVELAGNGLWVPKRRGLVVPGGGGGGASPGGSGGCSGCGGGVGSDWI